MKRRGETTDGDKEVEEKKEKRGIERERIREKKQRRKNRVERRENHPIPLTYK